MQRPPESCHTHATAGSYFGICAGVYCPRKAALIVSPSYVPVPLRLPSVSFLRMFVTFMMFLIHFWGFAEPGSMQVTVDNKKWVLPLPPPNWQYSSLPQAAASFASASTTLQAKQTPHLRRLLAASTNNALQPPLSPFLSPFSHNSFSSNPQQPQTTETSQQQANHLANLLEAQKPPHIMSSSSTATPASAANSAPEPKSPVLLETGHIPLRLPPPLFLGEGKKALKNNINFASKQLATCHIVARYC